MVDLEGFQTAIGYSFHDPELLLTALTHSSYAHEHHDSVAYNERLEFLGDSVLGMETAEYYFKERADLPEGMLTKMRAATVCENSLHQFAQSIQLGDHLRLSRGEENTGGRKRPSILADAFEAVIAAIYLDGGFEAAKAFVLRFVRRFTVDTASVTDYKSALQETTQTTPGEILEYFHVGESGPDHDKTFIVEVRLNSNVLGVGQGKSKKQAEQNAACEALKFMGIRL